MRILQCLGSMNSNQGGPPRVVEGLSLCLADLGHEIFILGGETAYDAAAFSREWPKLASHPLINYLPPTHRWCTQYEMVNFDAVHFHGVWDVHFLTLSKACRAAHVPYFVSSHGCLDPWSFSQKALKKTFGLYVMGYRKFLNNAAGLIYGTQDEANQSCMKNLSPPALVLPNGVGLDADIFEDTIDLPVDSAAVFCRDITLLYFSRIHHKKGVHLLIEAFLGIADKYTNVGLVVAGISEDESLESEIRARAADCDQIYITTDLTGPKAKAIFRHCNAFVLPTFQEGFSISILEALFFGLPVVITSACRLPEVVTTGCGWECEPTVGDIQKTLHQVCQTSPSTLRKMGKNGRAFVMQHYTWPAIAQEALSIYTASLDKK